MRGCQFELDEFGRDASSFLYLKHLPADFLKIDGAFVRGMLNDRRDQAIVRSIAKLASDFGMYSVAEQVGHRDGRPAARNGGGLFTGLPHSRPEAFPFWAPFARAQTDAWPPASIRPPHLTLVS